MSVMLVGGDQANNNGGIKEGQIMSTGEQARAKVPFTRPLDSWVLGFFRVIL